MLGRKLGAPQKCHGPLPNYKIVTDVYCVSNAQLSKIKSMFHSNPRSFIHKSFKKEINIWSDTFKRSNTYNLPSIFHQASIILMFYNSNLTNSWIKFQKFNSLICLNHTTFTKAVKCKWTFNADISQWFSLL